MAWISGFIITVLCIVLITSVCDALMPEGNLSKYVRMVLGLVVMVTVVGAALGITKIDFDSVFALEDTPVFDKQNAALEYNRQLTQNFKINLQQNAERYIQEHFGTEAKVLAEVSTDEEANITGIEGLVVTLETAGVDTYAIASNLANLYGLNVRQVTVGRTD